MPPIWPVIGAGLFASADAVLDAQLPLGLITLDDLPQWRRTKRDLLDGVKPVSVEHAIAAVQMFADGSSAAIPNIRVTVNKRK
ncbi:hypothetical protein CR51_26060 [Caballeronia megalochromosomata]|nr:hypothetical protein CR51_26060 [Caballeronia megalochromosomata]